MLNDKLFKKIYSFLLCFWMSAKVFPRSFSLFGSSLSCNRAQIEHTEKSGCVRWCFPVLSTCIYLVSWLRVCFSHFPRLWFSYQKTIISLQLPLLLLLWRLSLHWHTYPKNRHSSWFTKIVEQTFSSFLSTAVVFFCRQPKFIVSQNRYRCTKKIGSFFPYPPAYPLLRIDMFHYTSDAI